MITEHIAAVLRRHCIVLSTNDTDHGHCRCGFDTDSVTQHPWEIHADHVAAAVAEELGWFPDET